MLFCNICKVDEISDFLATHKRDMTIAILIKKAFDWVLITTSEVQSIDNMVENTVAFSRLGAGKVVESSMSGLGLASSKKTYPQGLV